MATCVIHWSSLVEGDEQQSNLRGTLPCMFWIFFSVCQKHNSLPLGPIQPSSPSTKELHGAARSKVFLFTYSAIVIA